MTLQFAITLFVMLALAGIGAPIGFAIILSSIVYLIISGQDIALAGEQILNGLYGSFILLAVPLFIVAANIMTAGTISNRLLNFCVAGVGRFRGGLGHVNVCASLIFSGMSGSAVADAAGIGKIMIGMMTKGGRYPPGYAAAITAASATIGPIIPPSIPMVLYALVSNQSIGYLFLGGIIPGLVMGAVLMALNSYIATRRGFQPEEAVPLRKLPRMTAEAFPALMMPVILLYGIYGGLATPTEAAGVAATYALLAAFFYRALKVSTLYEIFVDSARSSAAVGLVIGGALILNYVVASENIPSQLADAMVGLDVSPLVFFLGVNVLLLLLGAVLEAGTIILVILPLFIPICQELGIDLVHFGVIAVINCMIGLVTPPYGIVLFVINAGAPDIPMRHIIREIWVFLGVLIGALVLLILVPDLVLWLPRQFGYQG